jgi:NADH-quinone oxidoreductase subunit I
VRSYFASAARALATSFSNVFRKPVTVEFPDVIRPRAERYRASFALLHEEDGDEACIGCLQCERICPSEVISIKAAGKRESPITGKKRGYADDFVLDLNACIYCELCVQVCPTDAIVMTREHELPAYGREDLVLTMAKLYANEKSKLRAWGDATRLNAMQTAPKAPKPEPTAKPAAPAAAAPATASAPASPAAVAPAPTSAPASPAAVAPATPAIAVSPPAPSTAPIPLPAPSPAATAPASPAAAAAPAVPSGGPVATGTGASASDAPGAPPPAASPSATPSGEGNA